MMGHVSLPGLLLQETPGAPNSHKHEELKLIKDMCAASQSKAGIDGILVQIESEGISATLCQLVSGSDERRSDASQEALKGQIHPSTP